MSNDTVEPVNCHCECGTEKCNEWVELTEDVYRIVVNQNLVIISALCAGGPMETDEFIENGSGYSLYRENREKESE